jgi:hypothetical protein
VASSVLVNVSALLNNAAAAAAVAMPILQADVHEVESTDPINVSAARVTKGHINTAVCFITMLLLLLLLLCQ